MREIGGVEALPILAMNDKATLLCHSVADYTPTIRKGGMLFRDKRGGAVQSVNELNG